MHKDISSKMLLISETSIKIHPEISSILSISEAETRKIGLVLKNFYKGYSSMSSYLYPKADSARVIEATIFFNILYFFDEMYGEDTASDVETIPNLRTIMQIWNSESKTSGEAEPRSQALLANGIHKIKEILSKAEPGLADIIVGTLFNHLKHSLAPKKYKSLEEYVSTRLEFSGMYLSIEMMEYVCNVSINVGMREKLNPLTELCAEIGALSNDVFSYPKETHSEFNLINVLLKLNTEFKLEEAIDESIEIVNKKYLEFKDIMSKFRSEELPLLSNNQKESVLAYLNGLNNIVSGSYHWQKSTERYKHMDHFFQDLK